MLSPRMAAAAAIALLVALLSVQAAFAQAPSPSDAPRDAPGQDAPAASGRMPDVFGREVTLPERKIIYLKGAANWDSAFATLVDALRSVYGYLGKEGIAPAGAPMTIYTQTDDAGFEYEAAVPVVQEPKVAPQGDIAIGQAPSGKALKFVHRGSYDDMDTTYEAITNYLDEKGLEAKDLFIEEYMTDPTKTPDGQLVINIYVPTK